MYNHHEQGIGQEFSARAVMEHWKQQQVGPTDYESVKRLSKGMEGKYKIICRLSLSTPLSPLSLALFV